VHRSGIQKGVRWSWGWIWKHVSYWQPFPGYRTRTGWCRAILAGETLLVFACPVVDQFADGGLVVVFYLGEQAVPL